MNVPRCSECVGSHAGFYDGGHWFQPYGRILADEMAAYGGRCHSAEAKMLEEQLGGNVGQGSRVFVATVWNNVKLRWGCCLWSEWTIGRGYGCKVQFHFGGRLWRCLEGHFQGSQRRWPIRFGHPHGRHQRLTVPCKTPCCSYQHW